MKINFYIKIVAEVLYQFITFPYEVGSCVRGGRSSCLKKSIFAVSKNPFVLVNHVQLKPNKKINGPQP